MSTDAVDLPGAAAIPRPLTSLIGREREIEAASALMRREDVQLVTLTGPGGVGKTRLATETAAGIAPHFPDGVRFIALASLTEPEAVLPAIARALRVQERGNTPLVEQIAASMRDRRLLLVVDNFEHLPDVELSGDEVLATSYFKASQAIAQELGDPWQLSQFEGDLAWRLERRGEIARSAQHQRQALEARRLLGDEMLLPTSLCCAAIHAAEIGRWAQAVRLLSATEHVRRRTGTAVPFEYAERYDRDLEQVRARLGEREFAAEWAAGASMGLDAVVAEANDALVAWGRSEAIGRAPSAPLHGLSPREIEVLRLVAAGKTNREIAGELFISVPTVKVHVRAILTKLGLESRTAAAASAIQNQLI